MSNLIYLIAIKLKYLRAAEDIFLRVIIVEF